MMPSVPSIPDHSAHYLYAPLRPRAHSTSAVRRRPDPRQGRALEILAHAIEYLADSELHNGHDGYSQDVTDATEILMARNRAVFATCAEVVPVHETVRQTLIRMFGRPALVLPAGYAVYRWPDTLAG